MRLHERGFDVKLVEDRNWLMHFIIHEHEDVRLCAGGGNKIVIPKIDCPYVEE